MSSPSSTSSGHHEPSTGKKRVSAEHTLNRVRENQRRHRARRKDYIDTLEKKLADTERQLEEAKREIERLRAGRNDAQWSFNIGVMLPVTENSDSQTTGRIEEIRDDADSGAALRITTWTDAESGSTVTSPELYETADIASLSVLSPVTSNEPPLSQPEFSGPPPCCIDEQVEALLPTADTNSSALDPECVSCKTRPPPAPTESTTLCSQAYVLIAQQNFRGIDAGTIRTWLYQGFRRAQRAGEGCRVENTALMSLLDFISGCEERVGVPCGHQDAHQSSTGDCLF